MIENKIIDRRQQELAELAIREAIEKVDYDTVDCPLEQFIDSISQDQIEEYLLWDNRQQSYFIESLLLGLPLLNIISVCDRQDVEGLRVVPQLFNRDEFKVIDGKQRLSAALNFVSGNLQLEGLCRLNTVNGFCFKDLALSRQRKFRRLTVRAIVLSSQAEINLFKI